MKMSSFRALAGFALVKIIILSAFALGAEAAEYRISKDSKIAFEITKFMVLSVEGVFKDFDGVMSLDDAGKITALHIQAKSASVSTGKAKRDKFAREELLKSANYPLIDLKLVSYKPSAEKNGIVSGKVIAKLYMHGKTKDIEFSSSLNLATRALTLKGKINNKDFGMKGKFTSSNDVRLVLQTEWMGI